MVNSQRTLRRALLLSAGLVLSGPAAVAQTANRDAIGDLLRRGEDGPRLAQQQPAPKPGTPPTVKPPAVQPPATPAPSAEATKDPREGDAAYEQAQRLMKAVDAILQDTAKNRGEARKLPSDKDFILKPIWTESKEDREKKIRELLDAALGIVTDVPVVDVQK